MAIGEDPGSPSCRKYTKRWKMSILNTTALPLGVRILALGEGNSFTASTYWSNSKFKQHLSLPHCPANLPGFNDNCW